MRVRVAAINNESKKMARTFCKHYRGMHQKDECEAGVEFATLEHYGTKQFSKSCPCFGPDRPGKCEHKVYPTAEEMEAEDARMNARFENMRRAREAIVERCGGPWTRGDAGQAGMTNCPVCGGVESLRFSRSGYNGHIHAKCTTTDCVAWMEPECYS